MVMFEGFANLVDVSAMNANRFVKLLTCDFKLLCPVMNIGREFGIDLVGIVGPLRFRLFLFFSCWSRFRQAVFLFQSGIYLG